MALKEAGLPINLNYEVPGSLTMVGCPQRPVLFSHHAACLPSYVIPFSSEPVGVSPPSLTLLYLVVRQCMLILLAAPPGSTLLAAAFSAANFGDRKRRWSGLFCLP